MRSSNCRLCPFRLPAAHAGLYPEGVLSHNPGSPSPAAPRKGASRHHSVMGLLLWRAAQAASPQAHSACWPGGGVLGPRDRPDSGPTTTHVVADRGLNRAAACAGSGRQRHDPASGGGRVKARALLGCLLGPLCGLAMALAPGHSGPPLPSWALCSKGALVPLMGEAGDVAGL